ncbi:hypothetical protein D6D10_10318 [Aureobasidium pullulans]|uniref:Uncharacterized protein n=1 Tax=Aureobasidium pullulans TaxID=5580 RepID=A0A4S9DQR3_AURPU|nr:hypothetical protein D6D10_10318 [Aureobasidium pullulans]
MPLTDLAMSNSDLTRFERESAARLREEEARHEGVSETIAFLTPRRPPHTRSASGAHGFGSRYEPGTPRNPFPGPGSQHRRRHEAPVSIHTSPDALLNGALVASAERMHRMREELLTPSRPRQPDFGGGSTSRRRRADRSLSPFQDLVTPTRRSRAEPASRSARTSRSVRFDETPLEEQLAALRRRVEELSATSPSVRRTPAFRDEEDPTLMSGGAGGPVNPALNAGSPYVRPGPTNDLDARRRADRAAEEDRLAALERNQREYDLLRSRSPRLGSAGRGRDAARTHTPEHISLADRTRRPYAVGPEEREQRRRDFEAAAEAERLVDAEELVEEERRAAERGRRLSRGDPPVFDLRSPSRSRSPSPNFPAGHPVGAVEVLQDFMCFRCTYHLKATEIDACDASHEPGMSKACWRCAGNRHRCIPLHAILTPYFNDVVRAKDALLLAQNRQSSHLRTYELIVQRTLLEFHNRRRQHGNSSTQRVGDIAVPRVFHRNMTTDEIMRREALIESQRMRRALEAAATPRERRSRSRARGGGGRQGRRPRRSSGPAGVSPMELDSIEGYSDDDYSEE